MTPPEVVTPPEAVTPRTRVKARRRPGPWHPIAPTIVPCKVIFTDALCADVPSFGSNKEHGGRTYLVLTPRQRCKLESEAA